jgi:CDP-diglyceride synthetase
MELKENRGGKIFPMNTLKGFILTIVFLIVAKLFFVEAYNIPSKSMEPTLLQGILYSPTVWFTALPTPAGGI